MRLVINGSEHKAVEVMEAEHLRSLFASQENLEIWITHETGSLLCALLNARFGWMMFLRFPEDAGFSSRNCMISSNESDTESFILANGQVDRYPRKWTFERDAILDAVIDFAQSGIRPLSVDWHDDTVS